MPAKRRVRNRIRVAVVDDDPDIHLLIKDILQHTRDFKCVGCVSNGTDALAALPGLRPELVLMLNSAANGVHFYAYDGNGNVKALVKGSDGTASASYEYEPFAQAIKTTGSMAKENQFRFSTKRTENALDFVLYEIRVYNATLGHWLSRDPLEEDGGVNLYCGLQNDPLNGIDQLGAKAIRIGVGFDQGTRRTKQLFAQLDKQVQFVQKMIDFCIHQTDCGCMQTEEVQAWMVHDVMRNKPSPSDNDYNISGDYRDRDLARANFAKVRFGSVHIVVTGSSIDGSYPEGYTFAWTDDTPFTGILMSFMRPPPEQTMAHELGHFVDYIGDDRLKIHSTDPRNLMHSEYVRGAAVYPDCQWCQKVLDLAR